MPAQSNPDPAEDLVLESYGGGHALLRPELDRYVLTDAGRRQLAYEALFGRPWPKVCEAAA